MKLTRNFAIFLGGILLLCLVNLLVTNDVAVIWNGPEAWRIWQMQSQEVEPNLFLWRLPGVIIFILSLVLFWFLGQKIFGKRSTLMGIVVLGTSLLIPNLSKQVTWDSWLLLFHLTGLLGLLLYLKQPKRQWQLLFYVSLVPGIWLQPLSSLVTFALFSTALYFLHPQGKRLLKLFPWGALALIFAGWYVAGQIDWSTKGYLIASFRQPFHKNLLYQLAGLLPFMGFVLAGLWEVFQKVRKREEFSLILSLWLVSALVGQSLLFSAGLALLVGKQLDAYFIRQYPYRSIVKTGAILHALLAFFGITFLLMGGFYTFKGVGFRAALAFGALYWMPSFIAIIGLYGMNRRFVLGGTITSAALATLFFWLQLYPLVRNQLDWPGEAIAEILATAQKQDTLWVYRDEKVPFPAFVCYANQHFADVKLIGKEERLESVRENENKRPVIIFLDVTEKDTFPEPSIRVAAWGSMGLQPKAYDVLLRNSDK